MLVVLKRNYEEVSREAARIVASAVRAKPRIVLGLYRAELAIVRKERSEKGAPEYGREKPSEIARYESAMP